MTYRFCLPKGARQPGSEMIHGVSGRSLVLGALALFVLMLGLIIPSTSVDAKSSNITTIALPVISCPTIYVSTPSISHSAEATVSVPTSSSHDYSLYSDSKRTLAPLLAPKGWHCKGEIAEDGSLNLTLYPIKALPAASSFGNAEQIVATSDGACQGCIADDVCPYFENAQTQLGFAGMSCTTTKPNDEQDSFVTGSNTSDQGSVDIYDPPTKKTKYPEYAVLRYSDTTGEGVDARETCVLPKSKLSWCRAITAEFVAKSWDFQPTGPSAVTSTTTTTPPVEGLSVQQVAQAVQTALINGQVQGAAAIADAVVTCGPPNASLTTGSYIGCDFSSASVGGVAAILQMTGSSASDFTVVNISSANVCSGMTAAAVQAEDAWDSYQGLPPC